MPDLGTIDEIIIKIGANVNDALVGIRKVDVAVDNMNSGVEKAASGIRSATGKIIKSFTMVGAAAAVGLVVGVGKATMTFADFEQAVTNAASVTGKSGAEYEATKKNIEELSKTLGESTVFSAQQAASAMYDLASAGYDVGTMVRSDLEPIMNLAAATKSDLTFATETVTSTLGQFGLGIEHSSKVSDIFAKTIGSSKATLDKLSLSMRYVGPVANSLGMDIEDVSAMLGQLYNAGFMGEQAGTALRAAMSRLMNPTKAVDDVLKNIGLTYDQVNPATHDFADTLALLQQQGLDTNSAMSLFGVEAAPAMMALMGNVSGVQKLEKALRDAGGAAEDMATKQLGILRGSLTILKSVFEGLMIFVGSKAAPAIRDFAIKLTEAIPYIKTLIEQGMVKLKQIISELTPTWENLSSIIKNAKGILSDIFVAITGGSGDTKTLTDTINTLTGALADVFRWIDKHPEVTKLALTIGLAAVAFAHIMPVVAAVSGAITTIITVMGTLSAYFAAGGTAAGLISAAIAAIGGPITIIIAAVALLGAAWATNFLGIRDKTRAVVNVLIKIFDWVKTAIGKMSDKMLLLLGPIGLIILAFRHMDVIKEIVQSIITFVEDGFYAMVNFLGSLFARWINGYIKTFNFLVPFLNKAGLNLNTIAELQFSRLEKTVAKSADQIKESANDIGTAINAVGTDIETSTTNAAAAYQTLGTATKTITDEMTASMAYAGVTREDLSRRAELIAKGIITPAEMVKSIPGSIGKEPMVDVVNEQKETNKKLDKLDNLDKLNEISSKLDRLKLEVNNYVTNNNISGGTSKSGGSIGTTVNNAKSAAAARTTLPTGISPMPSYVSIFK